MGLQTLQRRTNAHFGVANGRAARVWYGIAHRMQPPSKPPATLLRQIEVLRKRALDYPQTREDYPWGHSAFKVKDKAFAFLYADAQGCSLSVKLPESNSLALQLPFAEPTGYGLGKSGWVSAGFKATDKLPLTLLADWIDESFRAVAPKRLLAQLSAASEQAAPARPKTKRKQPTQKAKPEKPSQKAKPEKPSQKAKPKASPAKKAQRRPTTR
jgi:predicted DNA-binding protein (MmcQ/YjbR family)